MSFSLASIRWPWQRSPAVDVQAVARQAAREAVAELERRSLDTAPIQPIPDPRQKSPFPIYHYDNPYWYAVPQSPKRRPGIGVTTDTLRRMADSYDVLRACIQHLKREVSAVPVEIVSRDSTRKREDDPALDAALANADAFFTMEGGLGGVGRRRSQFEGEVIEDLVVIGAMAAYYAPTRGGGIYEVVSIDAATIRPRVDAYGWPGPGEAAYDQWIYGVIVRDYTREELRYDGVYPISWTPYFKSPVEWLVNTVNAGLRADSWNLSWLTDGTTPADTIALPAEWTPDQIVAFAQFDAAQRAGDTKSRQKTRWLPHGSMAVGNPSRKDQDFSEYELWLLRRTCAILGVQPASIGFAGEQYKVSQGDSMESTSQFGVGVLLDFRKALYDDILSRLGYSFLECRNVINREEDASERATRNVSLVGGAIKTPNEARKDEGLDPIEGGDTLFVPTTLQPMELALKPPEPAGAPGAGGDALAEKLPDDGFPGDDTQRADLQRWERKALGRLRCGRSALCAFESAAIGAEAGDEIREGLTACVTADDVRGVFRAFGGGAVPFDEGQHPRQSGGRFGSKGGAASTKKPAASGSGGPSTAGTQATAAIDASPATRKAVNTFFGREVSDLDLQQLVGAPHNAAVMVDAASDGNLIFHVTHPLYQQPHIAHAVKWPDGASFMQLDLYHLKDTAPAGMGTQAFGEMAKQARAMGMEAIHIPTAARTSGGMVGYYVWPRLGADAKLPDDKVSALPEGLKGAKRLSDLMATDEGRKWWKAKGDTITCTFNLDPESVSSKQLSRYLAQKQHN